MKIGVNVSIDVTAIDKARLKAHQNGKTYLNMTVFIDPETPDNYGNHGMVTQDVSPEERQRQIKGPILGNAKVFWKDPAVGMPPQVQQQVQQLAPQQYQQAPPQVQQQINPANIQQAAPQQTAAQAEQQQRMNAYNNQPAPVGGDDFGDIPF